VIGAAGIASIIPALLDGRYVFGLLQIVWFIWLGVVMLRTTATEEPPGAVAVDAMTTSTK
jgi:hypothetical protein